jgi:hypothetical protein
MCKMIKLQGFESWTLLSSGKLGGGGRGQGPYLLGPVDEKPQTRMLPQPAAQQVGFLSSPSFFFT